MQRTNAPVAKENHGAGTETEIYGDTDENRK